MARKLRVEYEGAIHHVVIRGVEQRRVFDDDADRERFLGRLSKFCGEVEVRLLLFCLMRNHVHLLVETPGANLGAFMHRLQTAYTVYYNLRQHRVGHLFQGRYKAIPVEGDQYLLKLSRYIHLNPVQVGSLKTAELLVRIKALRDYAWSSYPAYLGKAKCLEGLDRGPLMGLVGVGKDSPREYGRYVEAGLAGEDEELKALLKHSRWGIGSEAFVGRMQELYDDKVRSSRRTEDVSFRRVCGVTLAPAVIVAVVGAALGMESGWEIERRHDVSRAVAALMMCKHGGLRQREVAPIVGVKTGAAVSAQLQRLEAVLKTNRAFARQLEQLDATLSRQRQRQRRC